MFTGSATSGLGSKESAPEVTEKTILEKAGVLADKAGECLWWVINYFQSEHNKTESRRYRDPREHDPNYGRNLRELEGDIEESEPRLHIHNTGRSGPPAWQNKILIGVAITVISTAILEAVATVAIVASIRTKIDTYIQSNDQRQERNERLIDETRRSLDRGAALR